MKPVLVPPFRGQRSPGDLKETKSYLHGRSLKIPLYPTLHRLAAMQHVATR